MVHFRGYFFRSVVLLSLLLIGYFVSITNLYVYSTFAIALAPKKTQEKLHNKEPTPIFTIDWMYNQNFNQRGDYYVSYFKVRAIQKFIGNESITLSTPTDHTFLDNLILLTERWRGPISCAVYTPGTDFGATLKIIRYLRECKTPLIKQLVNFHLFFPRNHIPENMQQITREIESKPMNCSQPVQFGRRVPTYKKSRRMVFPINVARNIAREAAQTYFVFPSDIELVPSPNVIPEFFEMLKDTRNNLALNSPKPKVFVLPVFEINKTISVIPKNKGELKELYDKNQSVIFHKYKCPACHTIPKLEEWLADTNTTNMNIFKVTKRYRWRAIWEPFYIGTNSDPVFDERVTWEGKSNKRIQAYVLCLLDYEFLILNKAFLVHRPGIRYLYKTDLIPTKSVLEMNWRIENIIKPELHRLYGTRKGCMV